jgi:ribonucleoside-diphosphate reductase alpha chain
MSGDEKQEAGVILRDPEPVASYGFAAEAPRAAQGEAEVPQVTFVNSTDAPSCHECGSIMVRNGSCYKCGNCGSTSGCS